MAGGGLTTAPPSRSRDVSRRREVLLRVRALLAGGLVLGVGATLTLAAWNDAEHVSGAFEASVFGIESHVGARWTSHDGPPGATLTFSGGAGMSPGTSRYAHVDIRTTKNTTVAGVVRLEAAAGSDVLAQVLEYRTVSTGSSQVCDATRFSGSPTWVAGGPTTYIAGGQMPPTTPPQPPSDLDAGGATTARYCFEVRIQPGADNTYQGTSGTLTWQFLATSNV